MIPEHDELEKFSKEIHELWIEIDSYGRALRRLSMQVDHWRAQRYSERREAECRFRSKFQRKLAALRRRIRDLWPSMARRKANESS